jgi:hypothetical protein
MKKPRIRKIKVRYINTAERRAEREIDAFLQKLNAPVFDLSELAHA